MPKPRSAHRFDLRAPLVLDARELGRRPGVMRTVRTTVPAPRDLRTELVGVEPDAPLELDLRLESVMEGVLVSGTVSAPLTGECSRCLDPLRDAIEVDVQQLFVYPDMASADAAEDDLGVVEEDRLDLEPAVRDAVVLALPLSPRCTPDCPGLCPTCGARLAEDPLGHGHDVLDPRWAGLAAISDNDRDQNQES